MFLLNQKHMKQFVEPSHYNDTKETVIGFIVFCMAIVVGIIAII